MARNERGSGGRREIQAPFIEKGWDDQLYRIVSIPEGVRLIRTDWVEDPATREKRETVSERIVPIRRCSDGSLVVGNRVVGPPTEPGLGQWGSSGNGGGGQGGTSGGQGGSKDQGKRHPPCRPHERAAIGTFIPGGFGLTSNPRWWGGVVRERHDNAKVLKRGILIDTPRDAPDPKEKEDKNKKKRGKKGRGKEET